MSSQDMLRGCNQDLLYPNWRPGSPENSGLKHDEKGYRPVCKPKEKTNQHFQHCCTKRDDMPSALSTVYISARRSSRLAGLPYPDNYSAMRRDEVENVQCLKQDVAR